MAPGTVMPGNMPPGSYPVQPDLGQPVPPPQGSLPSPNSHAYSDAFPNNTNNTNYDGVDTQWKQPLNSNPGAATPFDANSTASGRNLNPGSGVNNNLPGNQAVPSYQDPNQIQPNSQPLNNEFPGNSNPAPGNNAFPGDSGDTFESNSRSTPSAGTSTQMNDQFAPSGGDQFQNKQPDQFEQPDQFQQPKDEFESNQGFSVPQQQNPVQQQSFESDDDVFGANPKKFEANSVPADNTFKQNTFDSSQEFEVPVSPFPGNPGNNGDDETFGPNNSSTMKPATGQVSHADHQKAASGPQLVRDDSFVQPAKFQPAAFDLPVGSSQQSPSPFNYDKQNYRWLRGIIEFDEQEKSWNITYNATPDKSDKFGGNIVLVDQGKLNRFTNGDVVLLDGAIDGSKQDRMGKPCYRISKAQRLVPKK
tara:strand:+ start:15550 stop:16803 length:1254 start_codon:yes stop_codon:yes gene_type:complete